MTPLADIGFSFNLDGPLGGVLGLDLVFGFLFGLPLLVVLPFALRNGFRSPYDSLSKRTGLAASAELRCRLNRYLRLRRGVLVAGMLAISQMYIFAINLTTGDRFGEVLELALLPLTPCLLFLLASAWPRWRSEGSVHLAHLRGLTVRDALTSTDWLIVLSAYGIGGLLVILALWRANLWGWSALAAAALACQALATYVIAQRIMNAPAQGSDNLELAWDDVLRLQRARSLLGSGALGMLFMIAGAADLVGITIHSPLSSVTVVGVTSGVFSAWNWSSAHRNWRRAWPPGALPDVFWRSDQK